MRWEKKIGKDKDLLILSFSNKAKKQMKSGAWYKELIQIIKKEKTMVDTQEKWKPGLLLLRSQLQSWKSPTGDSETEREREKATTCIKCNIQDVKIRWKSIKAKDYLRELFNDCIQEMSRISSFTHIFFYSASTLFNKYKLQPASFSTMTGKKKHI